MNETKKDIEKEFVGEVWETINVETWGRYSEKDINIEPQPDGKLYSLHSELILYELEKLLDTELRGEDKVIINIKVERRSK